MNVARDQQSAQHAPGSVDGSADLILDALSRERALHVRLDGRHIVGVEQFTRGASEDCFGIQPEPVLTCTASTYRVNVPGDPLGSSEARRGNAAPAMLLSQRGFFGSQQRTNILGRRPYRREIVERPLRHGNDLSLDEGGAFLGSCFRKL
ncbi:hypothetical protein AWB69_08653 [Caballeronia udeis]|uniref:Uncharacterized protein n=1 Tax=Caballeronia udeis TaxID=1232866 RepID=A0A158JRX2_9BURK|nr:hypothetical protein AWB69_08653 [Caballeronia udeis]